MMQPCASAARPGCPFFSSAQRPCCSSGRHQLRSLRGDLRVRRSLLNGKQRCHVGVRSTTPSGTSPRVTIRHRATSSLRASATIHCLTVPVRASAVSMPMPMTRASKRTIACFPSSGRCSSRARRVVSISCIWSPTKCKRAASSASVFGGGGVRSGVRNLSSCADALRDARALADEALALSVRPFGVFLR
jgi:hypothetical protein